MASERTARQLVEAAVHKLRLGQTPSARETAALRRFERRQDKERRLDYYKTVPKTDYQQLSGRPSRTLIDQARRYGLPYPLPDQGSDARVNLFEVLRWWHDFLAENGHRLAGPKPDDPMLAGVDSPALERYREERAKLARLDRLAREQSLLPRDSMREVLGRIARILRSAGESLGRQYGPDAQDLLNEALDDYSGEVETFFGKDRNGD